MQRKKIGSQRYNDNPNIIDKNSSYYVLEKSMTTLIQAGMIFTASETFQADILI